MDGVRVAVGSLWHNLLLLFFFILFYFPLLCFSSRPCSFCMNVNETKDKELLKNDNFIVSVGGIWSAPFLNGGWVAWVGGWWVGDFLWWQFLIRKYFKKNDSGVFFRPFSKQKKG